MYSNLLSRNLSNIPTSDESKLWIHEYPETKLWRGGNTRNRYSVISTELTRRICLKNENIKTDQLKRKEPCMIMQKTLGPVSLKLEFLNYRELCLVYIKQNFTISHFKLVTYRYYSNIFI